jgi:Domain of unknown function (DUF4396)
VGVHSWLHDLSVAALAFGGLCSALIARDVLAHRQRMWIMNLVWPITALFGSAWIVWQYFTYGRRSSDGRRGHAEMRAGGHRAGETPTPFSVAVATSALHCGAGCSLGDLIAEWLVFLAPATAVTFGWHTLVRQQMYAVWIADYVFAYLFGIFFQYFAIAPMRGLAFAPGLWAAIKADTLSVSAWQIGMYGFMGFANFYLFARVFRAPMLTNTPEYWFMMQIAMVTGFATSYPVNWWLITRGIKERM